MDEWCDKIFTIENHSQNTGGIMSTEVLSYFLKNSDRRVRLGFQVVLQCAPFLKGLKVSCVISVAEQLYGELEELFRDMEIKYHMLSCSEGRCLVLFYRPEELERYLRQEETYSLLEGYGYAGMNLTEMLNRLSARMEEFACRSMGFPHEVGVFLGYPVKDVRGFIENEGKRYLMIGYWKVYSDLADARMIFKEYDRAKDCAVNEFLSGKSVWDIALDQKWRAGSEKVYRR